MSWRASFALVLGVAALGVFSPPAKAQVRVTVNGGQPIADQNDGSSWEKALSARQLALRLTRSVNAGEPNGEEEYWVAAGTYFELWLHKGTKIYGGFDGTELFRGERDPANNVTSIPGVHFEGYTVTIAVDGSPDTIVPEWPDGGTLIDGCQLSSAGETVRMGASPSNGITPIISGSPLISGCQIIGGSVAVYANGGSYKLEDCDIFGSSGPGVVVFRSSDPPETSLELVRCQIHDNASAGIDAEGGPALKMTDCTVTNNCTDSAGPTYHYPWSWGGICLQDPYAAPGTPYTAAEIRHCTISNNHAVGVYIERAGTGSSDRKILVDDCTISQNVEKFGAGGGVRCFVGARTDSDDVTFFNCRISGNSAETSSPFTGGGGFYINGPAIQVVRCIIADNQALGGGGAVHLTDLYSTPAIPSFRDCLVINNTSGGKGGAFDLEYSDTRIINCTIANNHATGPGGAIYSYENRDGDENSTRVAPAFQRAPVIANCSFNGNVGADGTVLRHDFGLYQGLAINAPRPPTILNCTYLNGETWVRYWASPYTGSTTEEPLVLDPSNFAVADSGYLDATNGDYHLIATSLLIDRGNSAQVALGELDLDGQPRIVGAAVDIGAYEFGNSAAPVPPTFTLQPLSMATSAGGTATFTAAAIGTPAPTLHWQRLAAGGATWNDIVDGGAYSGATTGALTITGTVMTMTGDQFRCVADNGVGSPAISDAAVLTVALVPATVNITNTLQTYDGLPKPATITTSPTGLALSVTYNGASTIPSAAGTYVVAATITDPNYLGSATSSLKITPATASVTLADLLQTYDGAPKPVTVTTVPASLPVAVTYNGSATVPSAVGSYTVSAAVTDLNYRGTANGVLVINPAVLAIDVTSSLQVTPGGFRLNRITRRYVQTLTVRNVSAQSIGGPVSLVLDLLSANVTLYAPSGVTGAMPPLGSPYLNLDIGVDGALSVGETATLTLEFTNPLNRAITYAPRVLAGPGNR